MKKFCEYGFIIIFGVLATAILHSEARIVDFHARRENSYAVLEWATEMESNLEKFVIQRSTDHIIWTTIGDVKPKAGDSIKKRYYRFEDKNIFKNSISNFYYQLVIVNKDGSSIIYDVIVSVEGSSGIRHTWGSIKAMFR